MQGLGALLPPNMLISDSRIQNRVKITHVVDLKGPGSPERHGWFLPAIFTQERARLELPMLARCSLSVPESTFPLGVTPYRE